jgi:hypothetical protein
VWRERIKNEQLDRGADALSPEALLRMLDDPTDPLTRLVRELERSIAPKG